MRPAGFLCSYAPSALAQAAHPPALRTISSIFETVFPGERRADPRRPSAVPLRSWAAARPAPRAFRSGKMRKAGAPDLRASLSLHARSAAIQHFVGAAPRQVDFEFGLTLARASPRRPLVNPVFFPGRRPCVSCGGGCGASLSRVTNLPGASSISRPSRVSAMRLNSIKAPVLFECVVGNGDESGPRQSADQAVVGFAVDGGTLEGVAEYFAQGLIVPPAQRCNDFDQRRLFAGVRLAEPPDQAAFGPAKCRIVRKACASLPGLRNGRPGRACGKWNDAV